MTSISVLSSALTGYLTKLVKLPTILFSMLFMSFLNAFIMFLWEPYLNLSSIQMIHTMSVTFGFLNSIGKTQLTAFIGICFPDNWSSWYSVYSSFESLGLLLGMLASLFALGGLKYYIYLSLTVISLAFFAILQAKRTFRSSESFKNQEKIRVIGNIFDFY